MNQNKGWVAIWVILGIIFLIIGYIYASHSANTLPTFFPGYSASLTKVHTTHSIAACVVGLGCLVLAWFKSGPNASGPKESA